MAHHRTFDPRFAVLPDSKARYEDYLGDLMRNTDNRVLVAERSRRVIAYAIGMVLANPPLFALPRYGFIAEMSVEAECRGQGVGTQLWNEMLEWFRGRGVTVVQLNASTLNESGQAFWRRRGCRDFLHILWYDMPPPSDEV